MTNDQPLSSAHRFTVRDITVWRNDELILNRVSFDLNAHQTLMISGHNGSGKTTLLRVLAGLRTADEGDVLLNDLAAREHREQWAKSIAYCGHHNGLSDTLTVRENLMFVRACAGCTASDADTTHALAQLGIAPLADWPLHKLSAGQRRRAALASLLMRNAFMWLLDEPLSAIDAHGREQIEALIIAHAHQGGACILTSHQDLVSAKLRNQVLNLTLHRPSQAA